MWNIINPATEKVIGQFSEDTPATIREKFDLASQALADFAQSPLQERINIIKRFQKLLFANCDSLARTLSEEMGKPITQSRAEIRNLDQRIDFFIEHTAQECRPKTMRTAAAVREEISYEALGIIANISAWNYPYFVGSNVFIPALLCGNCVLYKASEYASLTGERIQSLLREAHLPQGVFQSIYGGARAGEALLALPLDGLFFTGSFQTGKKIAAQAAPRMIRMQLELGGKDAAYVHKDADIPYAAQSLAEGAFYNNGQSCCAVERIYTHAEIHEEFLLRFIETVQSYKLGDPLEEDVFFGPLARKEQILHLEEQIHDALDKGARIAWSWLSAAGNTLPSKGYYFAPQILEQCKHSMKLMQEESFGPVIGIQSVQDEKQALGLMQDSQYGLTAAVYSKNQDLAKSMLSLLNTGSVYWNVCDRVSPYLPWSGRRNSGLGSTLSLEGIRVFLKSKAWHCKTLA